MLFISPSLISSPMLTEPVLGVEIWVLVRFLVSCPWHKLGRHVVLFVWAGKVWIGWTGARHDRRGDASILCVLVYSCGPAVSFLCLCLPYLCLSLCLLLYVLYYLFIPWYILYFSCVFPVDFLCVAVYKVVL